MINGIYIRGEENGILKKKMSKTETFPHDSISSGTKDEAKALQVVGQGPKAEVEDDFSQGQMYKMLILCSLASLPL